MSTSLTRIALLATRNAGKLLELRPLFTAASWRVESLDDAGIRESGDEDALESFDTFELNALAKARWFSQCAPDHVVFADDSGIAVDALDGHPGVRSKRWSGRDDLQGRALDDANNAFLQVALSAAEADGRAERTARYVCAAACVWRGGTRVVRGECEGTILHGSRGDGGFGYDPLFFSHALQATFAEASADAKGAVSHRGLAFRRLLDALAQDTR